MKFEQLLITKEQYDLLKEAYSPISEQPAEQITLKNW